MSAYHVQNAWKRWNDNRDYDSSDVIIKQYKPLVDYHVNRIYASLPKTIQKDEIESLGMSGLYEALLKYDLTQNAKFETYASQRIRGTILDGLRKEDRMSRTNRTRYKKIQATILELEQIHLREVGIDEVAEALQMPKGEVEEILTEQMTAELLSIDEEIKGNDDNKKYIDTIANPSLSPEEELLKSELLIEMGDKIKNLDEREQKVLSLFYQDELTITEIGKVLGLSKSRVSQIHNQTLAKLKKMLI